MHSCLDVEWTKGEVESLLVLVVTGAERHNRVCLHKTLNAEIEKV